MPIGRRQPSRGSRVASRGSRVASLHPSQGGEAAGREGSTRSVGGGRPETRDPRPFGVAHRAGGGKKPSAIGNQPRCRESRVASLPRRRSRRTGGVDAQRRGWETRDPRPGTLWRGPQGRRGQEAIGHRQEGRESRVAGLHPSQGGMVGGCQGVIPLQDRVPPDGRGRRVASGVGDPRPFGEAAI